MVSKELYVAFVQGFAEAERRIFGALPDWMDPQDGTGYPVAGITVQFPAQFSLSHRDFLGALMHLGLKRDSIGDILVGEGVVVLFVRDTVQPLLLAELVKVGRVGVKTAPGVPEQLPQAHRFEECSGTVSSLRLDAVAAFFIREGREKAARLIRSGMVTVNGAVCESVSAQVQPGDKIAVRGHGKFVLQQVGARTKKERLHITCLKYS